MEIEDIKFDCVHFKGHIPCEPNKLRDKICPDCDEYEPPYKEDGRQAKKKILIIKLAAIGDVIRTTPLITKYRSLHPNCHITWITQTPDVLPKQSIDAIYNPDLAATYTILNEKYDIAINLDKDEEACMLLADVQADEKYGFTWKESHIDVATPNAKHKLITGIFDNISKTNTKNYLEEIFEICHLEFDGEEYLLSYSEDLAKKWQEKIQEQSNGKIIIGLNTGCGKRWQTRLWPKEYWVELINTLTEQGYFCMLLGGADEEEGNQYYSKETGTYYPGCFSLEEFISLTSTCNIILTPVTMMMHIAIGLKKQMVLFNNIFNKHEFELYDRGVIVEPESGCDCYYGNSCSREKCCMYDIPVSTVLDHINKLKERI